LSIVSVLLDDAQEAREAARAPSSVVEAEYEPVFALTQGGERQRTRVYTLVYALNICRVIIHQGVDVLRRARTERTTAVQNAIHSLSSLNARTFRKASSPTAVTL
jgi:hypothetical protein